MNFNENIITIPVDVTNPGQFFACCGLLELADRVYQGAEGWFEEDKFCVKLSNHNPIIPEKLFNALINCDVQTDRNATDAAVAPVMLGSPINMRLDWWLKSNGTPSLFKTWSGNGGSLKSFLKWHKQAENCVSEVADDLSNIFNVKTKVQGSYSFDIRGAWVASEVGFSPNAHSAYQKLMLYPFVEILGAIGLQRCLPCLDVKSRVIEFSTWNVPVPPIVAQVAVVGALPMIVSEKLQSNFVSRGSCKGLGIARIVKGESYDDEN